MTDETNVIDIETKKSKANHYIDNAAFLAALLEHRERVQLAKATDTALPQISNYLGDCFIKIARHLSYKSNFINYSYKDEMIGDAVENCLAVVNNFDPAKSKNPFAYFTQITYFAFIRRIQKEKKQLQTKFRYIDQLDISDILASGDEGGEFGNQFLEFLKSQTDDYTYEKAVSPATKKALKKKKQDDEAAELENEELPLDKQDDI